MKTLFTRNPLDQILRRLAEKNQSRIVVRWNQGLAQIPLALYALCHRVREFIPHAFIAVVTRPDLAQAFALLEGVKVFAPRSLQKGMPISVEETLKEHQLAPNMFDIVIESVDIGNWLRWQRGTLVPKLTWRSKWDELSLPFALEQHKTYIAVVVDTKIWALSAWRDLLCHLTKSQDKPLLLLGQACDSAFFLKNVLDVRGKTSILEMIALVKNHCSALVAPDAEEVALLYFLDQKFPLRIISLLKNRRGGVLRQKVVSPNTELEYIPLRETLPSLAGVCEALWSL